MVTRLVDDVLQTDVQFCCSSCGREFAAYGNAMAHERMCAQAVDPDKLISVPVFVPRRVLETVQQLVRARVCVNRSEFIRSAIIEHVERVSRLFSVPVPELPAPEAVTTVVIDPRSASDGIVPWPVDRTCPHCHRRYRSRHSAAVHASQCDGKRMRGTSEEDLLAAIREHGGSATIPDLGIPTLTTMYNIAKKTLHTLVERGLLVVTRQPRRGKSMMVFSITNPPTPPA